MSSSLIRGDIKKTNESLTAILPVIGKFASLLWRTYPVILWNWLPQLCDHSLWWQKTRTFGWEEERESWSSVVELNELPYLFVCIDSVDLWDVSWETCWILPLLSIPIFVVSSVWFCSISELITIDLKTWKMQPERSSKQHYCRLDTYWCHVTHSVFFYCRQFSGCRKKYLILG